MGTHVEFKGVEAKERGEKLRERVAVRRDDDAPVSTRNRAWATSLRALSRVAAMSTATATVAACTHVGDGLFRVVAEARVKGGDDDRRAADELRGLEVWEHWRRVALKEEDDHHNPRVR